MVREITNPVRRHFTYDVQSDTSTCMLDECSKVIKGNHAANLQRHLARWHLAAFRKLLADKRLLAAPVDPLEVPHTSTVPPKQPRIKPPPQYEAPGRAPAAARNAAMKPLAPKPRPPTPAQQPPPPPPPPPEVCLRWNSYHSNMQATFPSLLNSQQFVDVTLACEGRSLKCHKVMLSACSTYFNDLLSQNPCQHPIILMRDLKFWEVQSLVEFMYRGEVNVSQDKLPSLLSAAEALQIKGLASSPSPAMADDDGISNSLPMVSDNEYVEKESPTPSSRRIRRRRTVPLPPVQPIQPPVLPNQSSGRFPRIIPSTSGTRYQRDTHHNEPPARKRRLETSPHKSPGSFMTIKQEPLDLYDHSNDSADLPENNTEHDQSHHEHESKSSLTIKEELIAGSHPRANSTDARNDNRRRSSTRDEMTEDQASSDDEAHDNGYSKHHKDHDINAEDHSSPFDSNDAPDDILQPEVTMNVDSVPGDD